MDKNLIHYYMDAYEKLPTRAKELLFEEDMLNEDMFMSVCEIVDSVKSPIEAILFTAMHLLLNRRGFQLYIEPQYKIKINNNTYIGDFIIQYDKYINVFIKKDFKLIIECDGYDYHHTEKKQIEHDYERENNLKINGYDVIRFTGSQIYKNPLKCAQEVFNYVYHKGLQNYE